MSRTCVNSVKMKLLVVLLLFTYACCVFSYDDCNFDAKFNLYYTDTNGSYVKHKQATIASVKSIENKNIIRIENGPIYALCRNFVNNFENVVNLEMDALQLEVIKTWAFDDLDKLKSLQIRNNNLMEIVPKIFNGLKISKLDLQSNTIFYIAYDAFHDMPNLKYLNLDFNKIELLEADWFALKPLLNHISFRYNKLDELPNYIFENVRTASTCSMDVNAEDKPCPKIILSHNNINTVYLNAFDKLKRVDSIILDHNNLDDVPEFPDDVQINVLSVQHNNINYIYRNYVEEYLQKVKKTYLYGNALIYKNQIYLDEVNEKHHQLFVYDERRPEDF